MKQHTLTCAGAVLAAACALEPPTPAAGIPDALKPAASEVQMQTLAARGVQTYQCRRVQDDPQSTEWAFIAPEADLFDAQGRHVGQHHAGPRWESLDGSKVTGTVTARAAAPRDDAIPWLLLAARADGLDGAFARVTSIQRINTSGGAAPSPAGCGMESLGKIARVAYSADYVMFERK